MDVIEHTTKKDREQFMNQWIACWMEQKLVKHFYKGKKK